MRTVIILFLLLCTCGASAQKHCNYDIDTSKIFHNTNLQNLIDSLQVAPLFTKYDVDYIPKIISKTLNCWTNKFSIGNPGKPYQAGCTIVKGLPKRQLLYLGFNKNYFVMTYKSGGIATFFHIVIFKYEENKILDFWCGYGSDLRDKNQVLSYLTNFQDKLQSNLIHL